MKFIEVISDTRDTVNIPVSDYIEGSVTTFNYV